MAASSGTAFAEGPRRTITNTLGISVNPMGVQDQLTVGWQWALTQSRNPLLSDAHFAAGVTNSLSPAYERLDLWAEISPLSVLDLKAGVEPVFYFGTFGHLVAFPSYNSDFSAEARKSIEHTSVARTGFRYHVSPTFKIKLGRVAARAGADIEWWRVDGPGAYYYEPMRDTLLDSSGDSSTLISSQLFYELAGGSGRGQMLAGIFHDRLSVSDAPGNTRHRLGPIVVWTLAGRRLGLRAPTLVGSVFSFVRDPTRQGGVGAFVAVSGGVGGE